MTVLLQTRGMIDEGPWEVIALAQVRREGFDAEGFRRVMAAVEDVDSRVFGRGKSPVGTLAGDEGIHSFLRGESEVAASAAGYHPNAPARERTTRKEFHRMMESAFEP